MFLPRFEYKNGQPVKEQQKGQTSASATVGAILFMSGAVLAMYGFDMINQGSRQSGGGLAMIFGFVLLVLPGVPIALTGAGMVISAWVKSKKRQSTNNNDTEPPESD
jgi:hypothetical protein